MWLASESEAVKASYSGRSKTSALHAALVRLHLVFSISSWGEPGLCKSALTAVSLSRNNSSTFNRARIPMHKW